MRAQSTRKSGTSIFIRVVAFSCGLSVGCFPAVAADSATPPPGYQIFRQLSHAYRRAAEIAWPASVKVGAGGSGTIVTPDGYVVTNNHVVGAAKTIAVTIAGYPKPVQGKVMTNAPRDIAIVKLEGNNFPFAPFADSDKVEVGDLVIAIGTPYYLMQTATHGVITQKFRAGDRKFLRTDAAQNPGNSGGGLFNLKGELVGVNGTVWGSYICNATPSNYVKLLLASVKAANGAYLSAEALQRGYTGAQTADLTSELARRNKLASTLGAVVVSVSPGSPAQQAGIAVGDIITNFNGNVVDNAIFYEALVRYTHPGAIVPVRIVRNGQVFDLTLRQGDRSATPK